jgi:hypothetical protein
VRSPPRRAATIGTSPLVSRPTPVQPIWSRLVAELELGYQARYLTDTTDVENTTPYLFKLPLTSNVEVHVAGNGYTIAPGAKFFDDVLVGGKLHLVDQASARPSLALTLWAGLPADQGTYEAFAIGHVSKDVGKLHFDGIVALAAYHLEGPVTYQPFTALAATYPLWRGGRHRSSRITSRTRCRTRRETVAVAYAPRPWLVFDAALDACVTEQPAVLAMVGASIALVRLWGST